MISDQDRCPGCGQFTIGEHRCDRSERRPVTRWTRALAADVELLLRAGESPTAITLRLGIKASSIAKSLGRQGRADLGRPFYALASRQRAVLHVHAPHPAKPDQAACGSGTLDVREGERCQSRGCRQAWAVLDLAGSAAVA